MILFVYMQMELWQYKKALSKQDWMYDKSFLLLNNSIIQLIREESAVRSKNALKDLLVRQTDDVV